eukprot:1664951-Karenia_brevis.AAC.1
MTTRCGALRFIFIDEVEATGAETIGQLEHNVRFHIPTKIISDMMQQKKFEFSEGLTFSLSAISGNYDQQGRSP